MNHRSRVEWLYFCRHCGERTRAPRTHSKVCAKLIAANAPPLPQIDLGGVDFFDFFRGLT